jgi:hypothetical protein
MLLVVTAIQWCFHAFVVALNSFHLPMKRARICSVLIEQLTCSETPMVTIGVLVEVGTYKEQRARREENAQGIYHF